MRKIVLTILTASILFINACSNGQTGNTSLSASEFSEKLSNTPSSVLIDVRTPEEYSKGHLQNSKNFDWNGDDFQNQTSKLEKGMPVFIYCLSGKRSAAAASKMRTDGFKEVYELNGGIMKWRAANLPEVTTNSNVALGMTKQQFNDLLNTDKLVVVDFYADWCGPCKKMKPFLDEMAKDMADKITVIRINADDNKSLCQDMKIDGLPTIEIYLNKAIRWSNVGFISKEELLSHLK
ncbi:MAG: thioredoxin domain-containing protein [Bacteroidota bacterium]